MKYINILLTCLLCMIKQDSISASIDWRWNSSFCNWATPNMGDRTQFNTWESAIARAREIKSLGFKAVIINGLHFRLNWLDKNEMILKNAVLAVKACHEVGLAVIEHHEFTIPGYRAYPILFKHPEWMQLEGRYLSSRAKWACINNPNFRETYLNYLEEFQKVTNIDAYMLDEISWASENHGACKFCREKFYQETGLHIPTNPEDVFWTTGECPERRSWNAWRMKTLGDFMIEVRNRIHRIKPDVHFLMYHSQFMYSSATRQGPCLLEMSRACDFTGTEATSRAIFELWPSIASNLKITSGLADSFSHPSWVLLYAHTKDVIKFSWALARLYRQSLWIMAGDERTKRYFRWGDQMDDQNTQPFADVAIIASVATRNLHSYNIDHYNELNGWIQVLNWQAIPSKVIIGSRLNWRDLEGIRVLILPHVRVISKGMRNIINKFVNSGGNLIVTGQCGTIDENWQDRKSTEILGLEDLSFNNKLDRVESIQIRQDLITQKIINVRIKVQCSAAIFSSSVNPSIWERNKAIYFSKDNKKEKPLFRHLKVGKGAVWYSPVLLGSLQYEKRHNVGEKYKYNGSLKIENFMADIVRYLGGNKSVVITSPRGIISEVYKDKRKENIIYIHFLNAIGRKVKRGKPIQITDIIRFPILEKDIQIYIPSRDIEMARFYSPDLNKYVSLPITETYSSTILPKDIFHWYGIVKIIYKK